MAAKKITRLTPSSMAPISATAYSFLTEPQFQLLNGDSWILADDRDISTTYLGQAMGWTVLPADLRGEFVRAKKNGRTGTEMAAVPEMNPGQRMSQSTARPNADFEGGTTSFGNHQHGIGVDTSPWASSGSSDTNVTSRVNDPADGGHSHSVRITTGGDLETRPASVTMNLFIKVNP